MSTFLDTINQLRTFNFSKFHDSFSFSPSFLSLFQFSSTRWIERYRLDEASSRGKGCKATVGTGTRWRKGEASALARYRVGGRERGRGGRAPRRGRRTRKTRRSGGSREASRTKPERSRRARRRVRGTRTSPSPGHPASTKRCRANVYKVCRKIARPLLSPNFRLFTPTPEFVSILEFRF